MTSSETAARRTYRASWYVAFLIELTFCVLGQVALWGDVTIGAAALILSAAGGAILVGRAFRRDAHKQLGADSRRLDAVVTASLVSGTITATFTQLLAAITLPST